MFFAFCCFPLFGVIFLVSIYVYVYERLFFAPLLFMSRKGKTIIQNSQKYQKLFLLFLL